VRRLVVATGNAGKLREIRALLEAEPVELVGLAELPAVDLPEEGDDYRANAIAKARAAALQLGEPAVADDSGLEVAALDGRPGPHSARYGGPGLDDAGRVERLLRELEGVPAERRGARFVCHVALVLPDGATEATVGVCEGSIRERPTGGGGFGYDPVFQPVGEAGSMAELAPERKNEISHRARAFAALVQTSSWASRLST
jgi:XTP/dITP diphosphohydrolase